MVDDYTVTPCAWLNGNKTFDITLNGSPIPNGAAKIYFNTLTKVFNVFTSNPLDVGVYNVVVTANLLDANSNLLMANSDNAFTITITPCQLTSLTATTTNVTINADNTLTTQTTTWTQSPNCATPWPVTIQVVGSDGLTAADATIISTTGLDMKF